MHKLPYNYLCYQFLPLKILYLFLLPTFFFRKLLGWNQWSLYLGYSISFGLSLIGNFQLHSVRTAGKNSLFHLLVDTIF